MKICPLNEQSRSRNGKKWLVLALAMTLFSFTSMAQSITGTVVDGLGDPLPGASVLAKGTTNGTITNVDGQFTLQGVATGAILEISYVGYVKQEVAARNGMKVVMKEDSQLTDEVVVVGYGVVRKSDLTGAIGSVTSEKIANLPQGGTTNVLQGKIAGVNITSTSGNGSLQMRVRGTTSLNKSNEPLWVVDGVIGGVVNSINDVESIEVLKDASSTAIYGSQGANGVVLVTTKKAKEGSHVMVDTRFNWNTLAKKPDLLSPYETANALSEMGMATFTADEMAAFKNGTAGTDWIDALFRTGFSQSYNVNISGGSQKTKYYVIANAGDTKSQYITVNSRSYNVKGGINTEITPWLDFSGYMYTAMGKSHNSMPMDAMDKPYTYSTAMTVQQDENGVWQRDPYNSIHSNPIADRVAEYTDARSMSTNMYASLTFKIMKGLTFTTQGLYYQGTSWNKSFNSAKSYPGAVSQASRYDWHGYNWRNINTVNYDTFLGEDHHLTAMAGAEFYQTKSSSTTGTAQGISNEATTYWNMSAGSANFLYSGFSNQALTSFFGRAIYAYKGKYVVEGNIRADGASELSKDNRWAWFPSASARWNVSEEAFWNKEAVNQFDVRLSWGIIGNHGVSPYQTYSTMSFVDRGYTYGTNSTAYTGYWPGGTSNPDLKWEKTQSWNVGFDFGLLQNRITLTTDFYYKKTTDLLFQKGLPDYNGGGNVWVNQGQVDNKGAEFTLNVLPITNKNLTWESSLVASYNRNKVVDLGGDDMVIPDNDRTSLFTGGYFLLKKGAPVGTFYLYDFVGYDDNGNNLYRNADGTLSNTAMDRIACGRAVPAWTFGWNNSLTWKNWDFNALFRFTSHFDRLNISRYVASAMTGPSRFITLRDAYYASWDHVADKANAKYPRMRNPESNQPNSTQWLEGGSFIRLQNLTVGYTFPKEWTKIAKIHLGLSVQNLFVISGYKGLDPETVSETNHSGSQDASFGLDDGAMPLPRTYTATLRFEF